MRRIAVKEALVISHDRKLTIDSFVKASGDQEKVLVPTAHLFLCGHAFFSTNDQMFLEGFARPRKGFCAYHKRIFLWTGTLQSVAYPTQRCEDMTYKRCLSCLRLTSRFRSRRITYLISPQYTEL